MSCQKLLQPVIGFLLIMLFLVGCGAPATIPASEAPAATSTPISPTVTLKSSTPTLAPPTTTSEVAPTAAKEELANINGNGAVNGAIGIGDPYYHQLGNGGYDVSQYIVVLDVDPSTNMVSGVTTIEAKATQHLSTLNLDFQGLTVDAVEVNNAPATFSHQDHELTITPGEPLASSGSFSTHISYHGSPEPVKMITFVDGLGVVIRSYFPPDFPDWRKSHFSAIPDMIQYFNNLFGAYPFDEYGVLIADGDIPPCNNGMGVALETQTMSIHCPTLFMIDESVIVHELVHQWFGDSVSLENWQDIWLKEGIATYAEWLWLLKHKDSEALTKFMKLQMMNYSPFTRIGQPPADELYRDEVYKGGALVFHALRLQIGDEAFLKTLRTYLERYRYGNAGTNEFIAVAEEISGQELSAFFDSWLLETKLPDMPEPSK